MEHPGKFCLSVCGETAAGVRPKAPSPRRAGRKAPEGSPPGKVMRHRSMTFPEQAGDRSSKALEPDLRGAPRRAKTGQAGGIRRWCFQAPRRKHQRPRLGWPVSGTQWRLKRVVAVTAATHTAPDKGEFVKEAE